MDDGDGLGCLGIIASLSALVFIAVSFPTWRRGLVSLGLGDTASWWLGIIGAIIFAALTIGFLRLAHLQLAGEVGGALMLAVWLVYGLIALGYGLVFRAGHPPAWLLDPPLLVELLLDHPPRWMLITERVIEGVIGSFLCLATIGRRLR